MLSTPWCADAGPDMPVATTRLAAATTALVPGFIYVPLPFVVWSVGRYRDGAGCGATSMKFALEVYRPVAESCRSSVRPQALAPGPDLVAALLE